MCVCVSKYIPYRTEQKKEGINEKEGGGHQEFLKSAEKGHASRLAGWPFCGYFKSGRSVGSILLLLLLLLTCQLP